ncbi:MAG: Hsp70 family protein [Myxococcota bacterium]|nr:Hsp70 family protein [Myxococcota bacterium]
MDAWAIDLGTTHTVISYWLEDEQLSHILDLPSLAKMTEVDAIGLEPALIPSVMGFPRREKPQSKRHLLGTLFQKIKAPQDHVVGRRALELGHGKDVVYNIKARLEYAPCLPVFARHDQAVTARQAAHAFIETLVAEVKTTTGRRIRKCAFTVPVDSFDCYRTELKNIARSVGMKDIFFIDEPVAAALGYGLDLQLEQTILVADFGGGSLDFAAVRITPRRSRDGRCDVLAKTSIDLGGQDVDRWLAMEVLKNWPADPLRDGPGTDDLWTGLLLREARRVKEQVSVTGHGTFDILPQPQDDTECGARYIDVDGFFLESILKGNQFFVRIDDALTGIEQQLAESGLSDSSLDHVLLVGGTTLLHGVRAHFNTRFGKGRVKQWRPFSAVAAGGAAFAADVFKQDDFIVHDYVLAAQTTANGEITHLPIIKRGTRYPTHVRHFAKQFTPSCPQGIPETIFKLVIHEIACQGMAKARVADALGTHEIRPHQMALNPADPILGRLEPPHHPGDPGPRLDVAFYIDKNRWLRTTVMDLKTGATLLKKHPVAQLL